MTTEPNELEHHLALGCAFTALVATLADQGLLAGGSFRGHLAKADHWLDQQGLPEARRAFDQLRANLEEFLHD